jgi:citrate lyase subunit beta / citryl-CoA lyase
VSETSRAVPRRTILAVPGSSDRFIEKARTLEVDGLFLDLEDAVAPAAKVESRRRIVAALDYGAGFAAGLITVRVNGWESPWTYADVIEVVTGAGAMVDALVLPKTTSAAEIKALDLLLTQVEHAAGLPIGRIGIEAQIEDAIGLLHVAEIAQASPRLASLVFGPGDFMASLGMGGLNVGAQPAGYPADAFHHVLMSILIAARANGLQAIDGPFVAIRDVEGFRRSAELSAALGYDGKWVLHPGQVAAGNEVFSPKAADFERAQRIMAAYATAIDAANGAVGAIVVDEEMIDEAGVKLAAAIMARGRAAGMEVN